MAGPTRTHDATWRGTAVLVVGFALVVEGLVVTLLPPMFALALPVAALALAFSLRAPRVVVLGTLAIYLPLAGLLRRATGTYVAKVDPLNLVGPAVAFVCLIFLLKQLGSPARTELSAAIGAMIVLGLVEALNPLQGGLAVGLIGAGLFVGPLVWFYLGQLIGDARTLWTLQRLLRVMVVLVAAYGLKQLLFGFTGFEDQWIAARTATYQALIIGGSTRPFATFSSGAEYSYALVLGAVLFSAWRPPVGQTLRRLLIGALLVACFYAGSRAIFVTGCISVLLVSLVRRQKSFGKALAICLGLAVLGLALLQLVPLASGTSSAAKIRNRTLAGLSDPFNPEVSTLGIHLDAVGRALRSGFTNPIGSGAAVVTVAGNTIGKVAASAELDLPNALLAYGWVGLAIYLVIAVRVYRLIRLAVDSDQPELIGPAVFVVALFGAWFSGGLYVVGAVMWFFLGALDRQMADDPESDGAVSPELAMAG